MWIKERENILKRFLQNLWLFILTFQSYFAGCVLVLFLRFRGVFLNVFFGLIGLQSLVWMAIPDLISGSGFNFVFIDLDTPLVWWRLPYFNNLHPQTQITLSLWNWIYFHLSIKDVSQLFLIIVVAAPATKPKYCITNLMLRWAAKPLTFLTLILRSIVVFGPLFCAQ